MAASEPPRAEIEGAALARVTSRQSDYFSAVGEISNTTGVDGAEVLSEDGIARSSAGSLAGSLGVRRRASLSIKIPSPRAQSNVAFTALQYLPMPVILLSSAKQVILANDAVGRLLGIEHPDDESPESEAPPSEASDTITSLEAQSATEILQGRTLEELGLDLLQHGSAMTVAWGDLLDSIVEDASKAQLKTTQLNTHHGKYRDQESTPTEPKHQRSWSQSQSSASFRQNRTEVHDAIVDVIFSTNRDAKSGLPAQTDATTSSVHDHAIAKMIISVWATEEEQYFTMTFTAVDSESLSRPTLNESRSNPGSLSGSTALSPADITKRTVSKASSASHGSFASGLDSNSSSGSSAPFKKQPRNDTPSSTSAPRTVQFPPLGPPGKRSSGSAPSIFAKNTRLKDAILNSMSLPAYALWRDESFGVPNKAAIKLIYPWIEDGVLEVQESTREFLSRYILYYEDFTETIPLDHLPIMRLLREQKGFDDMRVGMYSAKDGSRLYFNVKGEPLLDDKGEFLGGLVIFNDVTGFQKALDVQKERNERQFEDITNMVPQMIWRATPEGSHDYYSQRWYDYTGLTAEESTGEGWKSAFHPDDVAFAAPRYEHSLATGEEYLTEYRCKSAQGEWRWMLGRAMPMRDEHGAILKWFGSCTDIHDLVQTRDEAKQTRAQLARVIECARITLWAVDKDFKLNLFAGQSMAAAAKDLDDATKQSYVGMDLFDIMRAQGRHSEVPLYRKPLEDILLGKQPEQWIEVKIEKNQRWFRTRMFPLLRQERAGGVEGDSFIDGVVAVSLEVTEQKRAMQEIQERDRDNARLVAQSAAAKEASKMKSQFLANMSHEIRTPIAGVIGMSELLLDDDHQKLTKEQRECAENIQRSANGLLTVINDILDFSKVESGRLDIEEVQFDLSVVIRDVNKMLGFAAERKGLSYIDEIEHLGSWSVIGDPGRLRQVMTNLLTNSIKFTSEGSVTMSVRIRNETSDVIEVEFIVQDTGIGIEEEVRRRLFTPFSQADSSTARRFGGTGLGLTISKNLVELMHGSISLESKLGVGTRASFWIPFHKSPYSGRDAPLVNIGAIPERLQSDLSISRPSSYMSTPGTPQTALKSLYTARENFSGASFTGFTSDPEEIGVELSPAERSEIQVLVVEDNAVNQQIALKTIKKLGFPVRAVWNGKEAVDYLASPSLQQPRPDIILMDVQMPIMDGYRATSTIRHQFRDVPDIRSTPIVAMTASAIQGDREKCQQSGMDDYLAKPVKKPTLERMLVKWGVEGKRKRAMAQTNARPQPHHLSSFRSQATDPESVEEHLSYELERLEFVRRAAVERSTETVDEHARRKQMADEKAISLRDDLLLEAGNDPKTKLGRTADHESKELSESLTLANVQKLSGPADKLKNNNNVNNNDDTSSMLATVSDSVGPKQPAINPRARYP